jgi:hypothetical protein
MVGTKSFAALTGCLILLLGSMSSAGILDDHPDAFNDGNGPGPFGSWAGTAPFTDGDGLVGTIDFAVFSAADFNTNFAGLGYFPADSLVYTYQVFNSGTDFISAEIVGVTNPASAIGQFDIGDVAANFMDLSGGIAQWDFPGIDPTESSWGLAFSSANIPEMGASVTVNGGALAFAAVPTPSATQIPEPASILMLVGGSLIWFAARKRG